MGRDFSLRRHVLTASGAHPAFCPINRPVGGSFSGIEWSEREADPTLQSATNIKNSYTFTTTFPIRLHGVVLKHTDTSTLYNM
jgi:hypothetical protein